MFNSEWKSFGVGLILLQVCPPRGKRKKPTLAVSPAYAMMSRVSMLMLMTGLVGDFSAAMGKLASLQSPFPAAFVAHTRNSYSFFGVNPVTCRVKLQLHLSFIEMHHLPCVWCLELFQMLLSTIP